MKNIYDALNHCETEPESGERMNPFEQARFYDRFTEHLGMAAPQTCRHISVVRKIGSMAACAAVIIGLVGSAGYGLISLYRNTPAQPNSVGAVLPTEHLTIAPSSEVEDAIYRYTLLDFSSDALGFCNAKISVTRKDGAAMTVEETGAMLQFQADTNLPEGIASLSMHFAEGINEPTDAVTLLVSSQQVTASGSFTIVMWDTPISFEHTPCCTDSLHYNWNDGECILTENGMLLRKGCKLDASLSTKSRDTALISVTVRYQNGTQAEHYVTRYGGAAQDGYNALTIAPVNEPHIKLPLTEIASIEIEDLCYTLSNATEMLPTGAAKTEETTDTETTTAEEMLPNEKYPIGEDSTTEATTYTEATTVEGSLPAEKCPTGEDSTTEATAYTEATTVEGSLPTEKRPTRTACYTDEAAAME